ncbi:unnamed protein product [Closterium sp. NIES-53]
MPSSLFCLLVPRSLSNRSEALLEHCRLSLHQLVQRSHHSRHNAHPPLPFLTSLHPSHLSSARGSRGGSSRAWPPVPAPALAAIKPHFPSCPIHTPSSRTPSLTTIIRQRQWWSVEALLEHGRVSLHQLLQRAHHTHCSHAASMPATFSLPPPTHTLSGRGTGGGSSRARPTAEAVVEALLEHGRLSLHQLVQRSVAKAGSSDPSAAKTEDQVRQQLVAALSVLIHERLVERVGAPEPMLLARGATSGGDAPKPASRARVRTRAMMESSGYFDSEEHRVVIAARCSDALRFQLPAAWVLSGGDDAGGGAASAVSAAVDGSTGADGGMSAAAAAAAKLKKKRVILDFDDEEEKQPATGWVGSLQRGLGFRQHLLRRLKRQHTVFPFSTLVSPHLQRKRVVLNDDDDEEVQAGPSAKQHPQRKRVVLDDDDEEEQAGPSAKRPATGVAAVGGSAGGGEKQAFSRQCYAPFPRVLLLTYLQRERVVMDDDEEEEEQAGPERQALAAPPHSVSRFCPCTAPHRTALAEETSGYG